MQSGVVIHVGHFSHNKSGKWEWQIGIPTGAELGECAGEDSIPHECHGTDAVCDCAEPKLPCPKLSTE